MQFRFQLQLFYDCNSDSNSARIWLNQLNSNSGIGISKKIQFWSRIDPSSVISASCPSGFLLVALTYLSVYLKVESSFMVWSTVKPLSNDHPHQRPSLLYDHISCDGQCFLFIRSLTSDHPSDATSDRVRWNFLPRGRPHRVFQNDCGMNVR